MPSPYASSPRRTTDDARRTTQAVRRLHSLGILLALLLFAACSSGEATPNGTAESNERSDIRLVVVTHGQASDPFWSVVKNGVDQAAEDLGVTVEYQAPEQFDMVAMAQLIDAAIASNPDGLIISIPDADALRPALQEAQAAGIPFISINSGSDVAKDLGALTHVGQTEYEAGYAGGERMATSGAQKALCVNQEVGNVGLDQRCQGFIDAMEAAGASGSVLAVEMADPTESQQRVQAALAADPSVDALLTLGPTGALPTLQALRAENKTGQVKMATFDLSPEILQAIEGGEVLFALDQQMFLQGYLPVVLLTLHHTNLNAVANDIVMTGPGFVTQEDAARLQELTARGTR